MRPPSFVRRWQRHVSHGTRQTTGERVRRRKREGSHHIKHPTKDHGRVKLEKLLSKTGSKGEGTIEQKKKLRRKVSCEDK